MLKLDQSDGALLRVASLSSHTPQKEAQPGDAIAALARHQKLVVVLAAMLLEVCRQIEEGLRERIA